MQLSAQRLGKTSANPVSGFQKNLDVVRLTSRYGRKLRSDKWFVAVDFFAQSLILKTYSSNYLKPINEEYREVAKFFSPVQITLSPGIAYKPDDHLSFFYSACGVQLIYVADNAIAATGVHGNDVTRNIDGAITKFKNSFLGFGSEFKAAYNNKYFGGRFAVTNGLRLFSNYLKEPQNIDIMFKSILRSLTCVIVSSLIFVIYMIIMI